MQNLKSTATDEEKREETLRSIIEDEKIQSEELNRLLFVKQSEVEKLKEEVERILEEHTDYKKQVLAELNQKREEIKGVKKQREEMDSERDRKRQVIVNYINNVAILNQCYSDFLVSLPLAVENVSVWPTWLAVCSQTIKMRLEYYVFSSQFSESSVFSLESALSHFISLYGSQTCGFMHTYLGGGRIQ